jgi:hypothetical protein
LAGKPVWTRLFEINPNVKKVRPSSIWDILSQAQIHKN